MTFVETLDPLTPGDDELVEDGDDAMRQFKRWAVERFESLVEDIDQDPLRIRANALIHALTYRISHTAFQPRDDTTDVSRGVAALSMRTKTSSTFYGTLQIPAGVTISKARIKVASNSNGAVATAQLYRVFDAGLDLLASFAATENDGVQILEQTIDFGISEGDLLTFVIILNTTDADNNNDAQLYWAEAVIAEI